MPFLDEAVITAVSGSGGRGCVSFRREKFIPKGGPDGGDGGKGGDIIIRASKKLLSLVDFKSRKYFKSKNGSPGKGKNQTGKNGSNLIIKVPLGTLVYDHNTGEILADLTRDNQEILAVPGGKGGKGNLYFATSTNRAPRIAQPGRPGEEKKLRLSLKYLADIGLVGLPNTGKSTLLSKLTSARPRIDQYPFTTIVPNLGVIELEDHRTFTIADIPGLIEGASEGRGLGHRFLKHIERTRFLIHLIDITYNPSGSILEDFDILQNELEKFNPALTRKKQLVLINKMDLVTMGYRDSKEIQAALTRIGFESLPVSALTGQGLKTLKQIIAGKL
jgi:GTP-binding protein